MHHDSQLALLSLNQPNSDFKVPKQKLRLATVSYITASRAGLDVQSAGGVGERIFLGP